LLEKLRYLVVTTSALCHASAKNQYCSISAKQSLFFKGKSLRKNIATWKTANFISNARIKAFYSINFSKNLMK